MTDSKKGSEPADQTLQSASVDPVSGFKGPHVYVNWLARNAGMPWLATAEYPLLTDAWITSEVTQGPYQFLNTVPRHEPGLIQPAVILRCDWHADFPEPKMDRTDTDRYHGGSFPQEVAALSSLAMGIRLKAGGITRHFEPKGDPKGRPSEWDTRPFMNLMIRKDPRSWILANAAQGTHPLNQLDVLGWLPKLSETNAVALVRGARLYQEALWLIESEPALSWLMLVSAVETAANEWRKSKEGSVDRLKDSKPELYEYLAGLGTEALATVAAHIADSLGATSKFVNFILNFLPPPPSGRPPVDFQHSWEKPEIRKTMRLIYGHRSRALHDGKPFPAPMCGIPFQHQDWPAPAERPLGGAAAVGGGVWVAEDMPMLLHIFEYIVRGVLVEWWRQGAPVDESVGGES